jgi:thiamine-monophosphate kinase
MADRGNAPNDAPAVGEIALIQAFRRRAARPPHVELGIGDDMAALRIGDEVVLVTADMLLDGVHFERGRHTLEQIGRKAMHCSLSDCAAMAASPIGATISFALCEDMTPDDVIELFDGMVAAGERFGCPVVGGDVTSWSHPLAIDVAMFARPASKHGVVRRDGAKIGDAIAVTGLLGGSLLRRHVEFVPRIVEAKRLRDALGDRLHAMIDITDGLALDLHRVCTASGVGAELEADALEVVAAGDARRAAAADGRSVVDHVFRDGEDFELLLCVDRDAISATPGLPNLFVLGRVTDSGLLLRRADGSRTEIAPVGYEHFRPRDSERPA